MPLNYGIIDLFHWDVSCILGCAGARLWYEQGYTGFLFGVWIIRCAGARRGSEQGYVGLIFGVWVTGCAGKCTHEKGRRA
jgi:hypothetical protein